MGPDTGQTGGVFFNCAVAAACSFRALEPLIAAESMQNGSDDRDEKLTPNDESS